MGGAMLSGWLAQGLDPKRVVVIEPHPSEDTRNFAAKGVKLNPAAKGDRARRFRAELNLHAGECAFTCRASSSKPTVCSATNARSWSPSPRITLRYGLLWNPLVICAVYTACVVKVGVHACDQVP